MKKTSKAADNPRSLSATALIRIKRLTSTFCIRKSRVVFKYLHTFFSYVCNNDMFLIRKSNMSHTEENSMYSEINPLITKTENLTFFQRISYGFGHIFNDLCAAMWFSYLLFYLQIILQMESATAGILLMIGQVSDALATPIAGWAVDKFGTRILWHFIGTIMVAISFPLVFTTCRICDEENINQILFYHVIVIIFFQIGWAIVQISHLSMIPNLTNISETRSELTAIRYTAQVCSSVITYIITWLVLRSNSLQDLVIGPQDYGKFKEIVIIIIIIGIVSSVGFYGGIRWKQYNNAKKIVHDKDIYLALTIRQMLLSPLIYHISLLYVASRLYVTLNLVYMPLYLDERVTTNVITENLRESLASVPLVSYIASFITALVLKNRTIHWNNKIMYFIGSLISFSSCICIGLYIAQTTNVFYVYAVAILIGTGSSVTIISSLCLTAEVIGSNINRGASIYSIVTFTDKLICGLAVVIIEHFKCVNKSECPEYYRYVLAYVSGGAAIFGFITLGSLLFTQLTVSNRINSSQTLNI